MKKQIYTNEGPAPQGPYSQAIVADGPMVYLSGQGPVDPETGEMRFGSFREQAELTFNNIGILLQAAGSSWSDVVKVSVFLADLGNFPELNEIYMRVFKAPYPARTTVQAGLPPNMEIEVDCIARVTPD